jgi:hypothetical protein
MITNAYLCFRVGKEGYINYLYCMHPVVCHDTVLLVSTQQLLEKNDDNCNIICALLISIILSWNIAIL